MTDIERQSNMIAWNFDLTPEMVVGLQRKCADMTFLEEREVVLHTVNKVWRQDVYDYAVLALGNYGPSRFSEYEDHILTRHVLKCKKSISLSLEMISESSVRTLKSVEVGYYTYSDLDDPYEDYTIDHDYQDFLVLYDGILESVSGLQGIANFALLKKALGIQQADLTVNQLLWKLFQFERYPKRAKFRGSQLWLLLHSVGIRIHSLPEEALCYE